MKLGNIQTINPRDVWKNEEKDFTPWLAENIEYISEAIGFTIEILEIEKRVGNYELDIYGVIEGTDKKVVIENQLEISDHKHLGQLLTYAAGLDASVIIWITPLINEEHKKAIEWLNEISNDEKNFFLIKPELLSIDGSIPAPRFNIEASPNDFERIIRGMTSGKNDPRHSLRKVFWKGLIDYLTEKDYSWSKGRRTTDDSWIPFSVGNSNYNTTVSMASKSRLRIEIAFISGDKETNKDNYSKYFEQKKMVENDLKCEVSWERLDDKKMSRIAIYKEYDKNKINEDIEYNKELYTWIEEGLVKMRLIVKTIGF